MEMRKFLETGIGDSGLAPVQGRIPHLPSLLRHHLLQASHPLPCWAAASWADLLVRVPALFFNSTDSLLWKALRGICLLLFLEWFPLDSMKALFKTRPTQYEELEHLWEGQPLPPCS